MFVLGCEDLIVSTDHKPLERILQDRDLSSITNPRLLNIKQRTLQFRFKVLYNPGKWHRGPDALSRNPTQYVQAIFQTDDDTEHTPDHINEKIEAILTTCSELKKAATADQEYQELLKAAPTVSRP